MLADLARQVTSASAEEPVVLTMFGLNGFKNYNDSFGHPAGDALLLRLGHALDEAVGPFGGRAYRPRGDELCVIGAAARQHGMEQAACRALPEEGEGFSVSTAFGSVVVPRDTGDVTEGAAEGRRGDVRAEELRARPPGARAATCRRARWPSATPI